MTHTTGSRKKSVFSKPRPKEQGSQSLVEYLRYLDIAGVMYDDVGEVRTPDASGPREIHNLIDGDSLFSSQAAPNIDDLDLSFLDLGPTDAEPGVRRRRRRRRMQVRTCPSTTATTPPSSTRGTGNATDSSWLPARGKDALHITSRNRLMRKRSRPVEEPEGNPRSTQESHKPSEKVSDSKTEEIPRKRCPFSGRTRYLPPSIDILPGRRPSIEEVYRRVPAEPESDDIEYIEEFPHPGVGVTMPQSQSQ